MHSIRGFSSNLVQPPHYSPTIKSFHSNDGLLFQCGLWCVVVEVFKNTMIFYGLKVSFHHRTGYGRMNGRWPLNVPGWLHPSCSSWATRRRGCLARHHLERWWHHPTTCSIPHRYGGPIASDVGWYVTSCCLLLHFLPIQELQQRDIRGQLLGKQEHQHQHDLRIFLIS